MTLALAIYAIAISTLCLLLLIRREHRIYQQRNARPGNITDRIQRALGRTGGAGS